MRVQFIIGEKSIEILCTDEWEWASSKSVWTFNTIITDWLIDNNIKAKIDIDTDHNNVGLNFESIVPIDDNEWDIDDVRTLESKFYDFIRFDYEVGEKCDI